jgi:superoxide reductase
VKRRNIAQTALLVTGGSLLAGRSILAQEKVKKTGAKFTDGIIYSKKYAGKWKGKEGSHAPKFSIKDGKVTLTTKHGMSPAHYIVRHTLVSEGVILGEKTFAPTDKEAVSTFTLPEGFSGKLIATSFCNLHDLWISRSKV